MALRTGDMIMGLYKRSAQWKELTDESLAKFKRELIDIAADVIAVCDKHHLQYVLAYGSALGAVRHQGFVPWDDDLDINMPRADMNKFLEVCEQEIGDKYFIRSVMKGDKVAVPTIHIRKKNTRYVNYADMVKMQSEPVEMRGIYIDIAAFENAPNNRFLRLLDGIVNLGIQFVISCVDLKDSVQYLKKVGVILSSEEKSALRFKRIIGALFGWIPAYKWYKFYNLYASKNGNNKSKYVCSYAGYKNIKKSTFERNRIFDGVEKEFEGHQWKIPRDYDYYLTTLYGAYIQGHIF